MEIKKNDSLNDMQQFRYELLQFFGTVREAREAEEYIFDETDIQAVQPMLLDNCRMKDGVYFVIEGRSPIKFEGEKTVLPNDAHTEAVGLVMGEFSIRIALQDEADGEKISLTSTKNGNNPRDDAPYYIESYEDAVAEMDGDISTDHLRNILNPNIKLQDGWYIPSLGEMYRIFINLKEINAALRFLGKMALCKGWYWTSTETSTYNAWGLDLGDGDANRWFAKDSDLNRVRMVSPFIE